MWMIGALIMITFTALAMAAYSMRSPSAARQRLLRLADGTVSPRPVAAGSVLRQEGAGWLSRLFGRITSPPEGKEGERLRERLLHAGYRQASGPLKYTAIRVVVAIAVPLGVVLVPAVWTLEPRQQMVLTLLAVGAGWVLPSYILDRRIRKRQRQITNGLPDALDLLVVCVEAGLGVRAGLQRVAQELSRSCPVLCAEIELSIHEIRAGKTTAEGLRGLASRTGVADLNALAAMLIQTERFGTSVADTLRVHADSLRSRRMQRAEELANKAPLKMLFPTTLIFIASLIVTIGPAMSEILEVLGGE